MRLPKDTKNAKIEKLSSVEGGTSPNQCANGVTMNKFRQK
jgi:hypothetical protein